MWSGCKNSLVKYDGHKRGKDQMKFRKKSWGAGLIVIAWVCLGLVCPTEAEERSEYGNPVLWVTVGGAKVQAEVVKTPEKLYRGLGYRKELPPGRSMLFLMPEVAVQQFCMRGMEFPIDIIWIVQEKVVGVTKQVPPEFPGTLSSPRAVNYVLEVPGGFVDQNGVRVGDRVSW